MVTLNCYSPKITILTKLACQQINKDNDLNTHYLRTSKYNKFLSMQIRFTYIFSSLEITMSL